MSVTVAQECGLRLSRIMCSNVEVATPTFIVTKQKVVNQGIPKCLDGDFSVLLSRVVTIPQEFT